MRCPPLATVAAARRVLVVDDNIDSAQSLALLLEMMGHATATAYDGLQALERAARFAADVVLLDIGMPRLDGIEVCRRLRATDAGRAMFIVALSGLDRGEGRVQIGPGAFDAQLVKPVELDELTRLLATLPAAREPASPPDG